MYTFDRAAYNKRVQWLKDARFGMSIHWRLCSIPARGEWVRSAEQMPVEPYMRYFEEFNPRDCAPCAWARAAKEAGTRYAVLTAKHHDGFCLFDSQLREFKPTWTRLNRDIVRDFLEAFRSEGLRAGLCYPLMDWHHPDYPHFGGRHHPLRNDPSSRNEGKDFGRYREYLHGQARELCSEYGQLDLLWFDFSYAAMRGEACITMNNNWGFCGTDRLYKPAPFLVKKLVERVSKDGNMILNVGPDATGNVPPEPMAVLSGIGRWMKLNKDSIFGCETGRISKPEYGWVTKNGNRSFFHLFENTLGPVPLTGIQPGSVDSIRLLSTGHEIPLLPVAYIAIILRPCLLILALTLFCPIVLIQRLK